MDSYEHYKNLRRSIADIDNILGVLGWDHEVNMPIDGAAFRAQQSATLSGILYQMSTSQEYVSTLEALKKKP